MANKPNNAWNDKERSDEVVISCWHEFLETPYGQSNVPDWFDKLQGVIQNEEPQELDEPSVGHDITREEWMILSGLNTPFSKSEETGDSTYEAS